MKKGLFILSLIILTTTNFVKAQAPGIKYQKVFNGELQDYNGTGSNNNKIISGDKRSYVVAGNVIWGNDQGSSYQIFLKKFNEQDSLVWEKYYGGSGIERFGAIQETPDGGFIVIGTSQSNDGDVSGNHLDYYSRPTDDIWVFKVDKNGNIQWQKCIGGSATDGGSNISLCKDGGYVLIGTSHSSDGDIINSYGDGVDMFVTKLSANGDIQWKSCFGGTGYDEGGRIVELENGNFLIGGNSSSVDGDCAGAGFKGGLDILILEIDKDKNKLWSKYYGSTNGDEFSAFIATSDGGYIVTGIVRGNDGDVTGFHSPGAFTEAGDVWIIKINGQGDLLWQQCIGGSSYDFVKDIILTQDNNCVIIGSTQSKDGDFAQNKGWTDVFVLKYDLSNKQIIWRNVYGGSNFDWGYSIQYYNDNEYFFIGSTSSNNGDVQNNTIIPGVWFVRIGNSNTIKGTTFLDKNSNGAKDGSDFFTDAARISITKPNYLRSAIPYLGQFSIDIDTGSYKIEPSSLKPYYKFTPVSIDTSFNTYFKTDSLSFALQPIPNKKDLSIKLIPTWWARIGTQLDYKIFYENVGTVSSPSGSVVFIKDSNLNFLSSDPAPSKIVKDTIIWDYSNFNPLDLNQILLRLQVYPSPFVNLGTELNSVAYVNGFSDDLTPIDDTSKLRDKVVGAKDPNEKTENHAGTISKSSVANGEWLTYTIRFQNTGTDTAFNIIVRDTLDNNLDWNSLEMIDASNDYQLNITDGNKCAWYFNNVLLPDSNVNEAASHGYIVYRIKPKTSLVAGDVINNSASIYFDYNLPVQTNTEKTVVANDVVMPLQLLSFFATHNGKTNLIKWSTAEEINTDRFEIQRSNNSGDFATIGLIKSFNNGKSANDYTYTDAQPLKAINYYRLKMIDKDGKFTYSVIKNVNNTGSFDVTLYPNPVKNLLTLNFNAEKTMDMQIEIVNAEGRKIFTQKIQLAAGASVQKINATSLSAGQYFIKCISAEGQLGLKFVKQ